MNRSRDTPKLKDKWRQLLIRIITLLLPVLFLLLLEGVLRLVSYGDKLSLFVENPREGYEQYMIVNPSVGKKYFRKFEYDAPPDDIFLKEKPEESFRIFVMGSSTVYGFPYGYNLMFSRILHKRIQDVYPDREIEMVNTSITAINSFTLKDFAREITRYEPDAVLLYAGHNEFYGAFGVGSNESMSKSRVLTRMHLWFMDFRFYQLFRNITGSTIGKIGSGKSDHVRGTLMTRIVASENIPFRSDDYNLAMTRYRQNMEDLVATFTEKEIPVFYSDVISNVRDLKPLSYLSTGSEDEAWEIYKEGAGAYNNADFETAGALLNKARDLDGVRFRASGEVNGIIQEICNEYGIHHVPMLDYFREASVHGIVGEDLVTEHVHPNIRGSFLMADAFYSEIKKSGILGKVDTEREYSSEYYRINWGYTELDSLRAYHRITNLKNYWPFVPVDARRPDYRTSYRPLSVIDSIAFTAFRDPKQHLEDLRLELARDYEAKKDYYAAYREYEALLRTNPYVAINYRDAATSLINLGHLPLALEYFQKSLKYEASFYANYRIGEIYFIKGDYDNAIKSFIKAFEATSEKDQKIRTLGKLYMSSVYGKKEDQARAIAQQLRENDAGQLLRIPIKSYTYLNYIPYRTREQVNAAQKLRSEGELERAVSILESSLQIYDSHVARRYLGEIYMELGKNSKALYHLNRVYSEFMFDPEFLSTLTRLYLSLNELQKAERTLEQLRRISPDSPFIQDLAPLISEARGAD